MIELQILNKILQTQDITFLIDAGIKPQDFSAAYMEEISFIYDHYNKYGNIPDMLTFFGKYTNCDNIEVNEATTYLVDKFFDDLIYRKQVITANEWGTQLRNPDSSQSFDYLVSQVEEIKNIQMKQAQGTDITTDLERLDKYKELLENPEAIGIKTGIKQLDDIIHAFLSTDLIVLAARTNQGKSFLALKIASNIWNQGHKILFYSGELNAVPTGYRFDTLVHNFSNTGLITGDRDLGHFMTPEKYEEYVRELATKDTPFIVVTPSDLGNSQMDVPTLKNLMEKHQPDFVVLDQLSLMSDARGKKNDIERIKYSHIMEDLRILVNEKEIPVMVTSQTNRSSAVKSKGITEPPTIAELSESDGVAHHATKALMFVVNSDILNLIIRKNTNGEKDKSFRMLWNKNYGIFQPFSDPEEPEEEPLEAPVIPEGSAKF